MRNPAQAVRALLAHPGTQHAFHLARELDRRNFLSFFFTSISFRSGGLIEKISVYASDSIRKRVVARALPGTFSAQLKTRPRLEAAAQWRLFRGSNEQEVLQRRNDAFQRSIPDRALQKANIVIGVDTASAILAERCKSLDRPFVLDQSIGHPDAKQAMHDRMQGLFPQWTEGFEKRRPEVRAAEIKEQTLATAIVTATSFAKRTMVENGVAADKIQVIPYGVDAQRFSVRKSDENQPFRFAFAGLLTARKGIPILLEAWEQFASSGAELWLIGPASQSALTLLPQLRGIRRVGAVSQEEMVRLLNQCDVFVFPSFFEGFGLVILEAMACGLPVITTTATAGPDVITQGEDGWILEPGDRDGLLRAMEFCLENRKSVSDMGAKARETAERFSWKVYGDRWAELLEQVRLAVRC